MGEDLQAHRSQNGVEKRQYQHDDHPAVDYRRHTVRGEQQVALFLDFLAAVRSEQ